jgi:hypothetical protein
MRETSAANREGKIGSKKLSATAARQLEAVNLTNLTNFAPFLTVRQR